MEATVYNTAGQEIDKINLSDDIFGVPINQSLVHQALVRQLANRRQGTADTKTRGQVKASTRKPFRQKHTGRARQGMVSSPLLRGGGVTFGPHPRSFRKQMPKKMRRLALKCVLTSKAIDSKLIIIDKFDLKQPKTQDMVAVLNGLGIKLSTLIAIPETDVNLVKSSRNIEGIKTIPVALLNVADLLSYKLLLTTTAGVDKIGEIWGRKGPGEVS